MQKPLPKLKVPYIIDAHEKYAPANQKHNRFTSIF